MAVEHQQILISHATLLPQAPVHSDAQPRRGLPGTVMKLNVTWGYQMEAELVIFRPCLPLDRVARSSSAPRRLPQGPVRETKSLRTSLAQLVQKKAVPKSIYHQVIG